MNIQALRDQISLVSQMPVLFPQSIFENIAAGKDNATMAEVIKAAQLVSITALGQLAHEVILLFGAG
jgi:ABC-type multidrug transport system fused ATPase/permease subunit